jgi:phosphatidate cytidylyltransferase
LIGLFSISILLKNIYGRIIFAVIFSIGAFGLVYEVLSMFEKIDKKSYKLATSITGAIIILCIVFELGFKFTIIIPALLVVVMFITLLDHRKYDDSLDRMINSASAIMMTILPLLFLPIIYMVGEGTTYQGREWLIALILITKSGDTGAYCIGMIYNKISGGKNHKIVPNISPKKSWEGTIGGCLSSVAVSICFFDLNTSAILIGILLFFGGFYGDLAESALKRTCGVKDSGTIIPGMGGIYDVLDSLLLNAPMFYFFMILKNVL